MKRVKWFVLSAVLLFSVQAFALTGPFGKNEARDGDMQCQGNEQKVSVHQDHPEHDKQSADVVLSK